MKHNRELLGSFDHSWSQFSGAWKKARRKASEKSIHDLRVSTRRVIATLGLAEALFKPNGINRLQRRFKKVLKSMGPLRDVQVQLESIARMRQIALIRDFEKRLIRRERRQIDRVHSELKPTAKHRLAKGMKNVRSEFSSLHDSIGFRKIHGSIERVLTLRRKEFLKAGHTFHRLQPMNEEGLHDMRIALKKFRYAVEAAQPVLGTSARKRAVEMHAFQQLMGDSRDVEMLRANLKKWAAKRGKTVGIVPALDRLQRKREQLLKRVIKSSTDLHQMFKTEKLRPVTEKTHAPKTPTTVPIDAANQSIASLTNHTP